MLRSSLGILVVLMCLSATAFAKPQYGLVGAWDFEVGNDYNDISGVAPLYNGVKAGTVSLTTDPNRGRVVTFTASGRVNFGPSLYGKLNIPDAVSFACWVKIDKALTLDKSWLPICGKGPGGYRLFLHGEQSNGAGAAMFPIFQYGLTGGGISYWAYAFPPDINDWLHVGCVYDGDRQRIYLNGQLSGDTGVEDFNTIEGYKRDLWADTAGPYAFSIGGLVGYGYYFKGSVDDMAIWRGVLDTQDFNDIYTGAKTMLQVVPKPPFTQFAWDQNVVAAYSFEGSTAELSPGPAAAGILENGAVIVSDTNQGNVLYGSGDPNWYVDCGKAAKFDNIGMGADANDNDGFTVTAWIKPDADNPEGWAMIASKGGAGYRMYYHSVDPTTGGRTLGGMVNAGDTPGEQSMGNGGNIQLGQWYHVAIVYAGNHAPGYNPNDPCTWGDPESAYGPDDPNHGPGRMRGFVDGLAAFGHPSDDLSPNHFRGPLWDTSADPLTIRTALGGFNGNIDNIRVYNRPLNQLEIRWVMEQKCNPAMVGSDFTGDCGVNYQDLDVLTDEWLMRYDFKNFANMAELWLTENMLWPY